MEQKNKQFDVQSLRRDFLQIGATKVHGKPLVYLDNAATTLKPKSVVDAIVQYNQLEAANIHRGIHYLSEYNTGLYEATRDHVQRFINARSSSEIIFTCGTTASINLVALSYGRTFLNQGDEIIISEMEHHSNIVPWQMLCEARGCVLKVIPINDDGEIIFTEYERLLCDRTRLVSVVHVSNVLGTVNPVKKIIDLSHAHHAVVLIDGAQAIAHMPVDVLALDCDFYAFSGHKMFGPTGVGVLYGKAALLNKMPPVQGGGDMIETVTFARTTYNDLPHKFEAGTPNISGVIALNKALEYIESIGIDHCAAHEQALLAYATEALKKIEGVRLIGTAKEKGPVLTFVIKGAHPADLATLIDMEGIAIRTGHHCAQPTMARFGVTSTARVSFSIYNTFAEVDAFITALTKVRDML